ncbi:MAG: 16S rRNA (guanine(527)-N(7))-methyltransferase RsmG [Lentisphaeria bacterium]
MNTSQKHFSTTAEKHDPKAFLPEQYPRLHFSDEAWQWFLTATRDIELAVDDEKKDILEQLYSHLVGVNQWLNLTRLTTDFDYLKFHIFDSLTVLSLVEQMTTPEDVILDLGSGGGYPGLPLMLWLPDRHFVLVDSRHKKVDFLNETLKLTPCTHVKAYAFRGREVMATHPELRHKCSIVTARAVGRGADLLADASELLALGGVFMLLKGPNYISEESAKFEKACKEFGFDLIEELPIALDNDDPDRYIILAVRKK